MMAWGVGGVASYGFIEGGDRLVQAVEPGKAETDRIEDGHILRRKRCGALEIRKRFLISLLSFQP